MTAPTSEPTEQSQPQPPRQPDQVVGVNDWGRVSAAWERVFDDVSDVGSDLKTVFKGAYSAAAVDPSIDLSDAVGSLGAEQFLGVSERLDRGLAGARAALSALGDELHEGGSERLHGEVEGAVKVSLYELGMLMIRMSDKLDGDVPPPRGHSLVAPRGPARTEVVPEPEPVAQMAPENQYEASWPETATETVHGTEPGDALAEASVEPAEASVGDSTEEIPEINLSDAPPQADDLGTPAPESISVRPATEGTTLPPDLIRPD